MAASHTRSATWYAIVDAERLSGAGPTSQAMNIEPLASARGSAGRSARSTGTDATTLKKRTSKPARP